MRYEINLLSLLHNLRQAQDETESLTDFPFSNSSSGVMYLYENVLRHIMENKTVDSSDIDFDEFDREDIQSLWEIYCDKFSPESNGLKRLKGIYEALRYERPTHNKVGFI